MVNSTFSFELAVGKGDVLRPSQCCNCKWWGQQTMGESQAPAIFQYRQYSSSHVHVSPGWKWWCCAGRSPCSPRQSDGRELPSSWAEQGTWWSQQCVGKGGSCFGSQTEGRVVLTVLQAPTGSWSQAPSGIRLTGSKGVRKRGRELHLPAAAQSYRLNGVVIFGGGTVQYCVWVWWYRQEADDVVFDPLDSFFYCGSHCVFRDICKGE